MSIEITPGVLEFKPPFTQSSTEHIIITNNSSEAAVFKVKTTAPKLYCVRPNAAVVEPGKSIEISIILLGLKEEPTPDFKCNDKFLIVALPSPYDLGESSVADVWSRLEAEFKSQSVSKKIKVKYLLNYASTESAGNSAPGSANAAGAASFTSGNQITTNDASLTSRAAAKNGQEREDLSQEKEKIEALNQKLDSNAAASQKSASDATKASSSSGATPQFTTFLLIALIAFIIGWLFF